MHASSNFLSTANVPFGAPFPSTAADNGLSVDGTTGRIVLGGDPLTPAPAQLLNDRRIDLAGKVFSFTDGSLSDTRLVLDPVNGEYRLGGIGPFSNGTFFEAQDSAMTARIMIGQSDRLLVDLGASQLGDIGNTSDGTIMAVDHLNSSYTFRNGIGPSSRSLLFAPLLGAYGFGDLDATLDGTSAQVDANAGTFDVSNTAAGAVYSINGVPGVSGTFTPPLSITVMGGIITAIS